MAKDIYWSGTGNNANNGLTSGTPKATYAGSNGVESILERGDTVKMIGTINENIKVRIAASGTTLVTFESNDHNNMAILDGNYTLPPDSGTGGNTSINGVRAIYSGMFEIATSYVLVKYIEIRESQGRGFNIYGSGTTNITNVTVENCIVNGCRLNGVAISNCSYVTIQHSDISNCNNYFSTPGDAPSPGSTWGATCQCVWADHITYHDNDIYHGWGEGIVCNWYTSDCVLSYNRVRNTNSGKIYIDKCINQTVIGNIIWDSLESDVLRGTEPSTGLSCRNEVRGPSWGAGTPLNNILFANNIIVGCGVGITFGGTQQNGPDFTTNVRVYNNIFANLRANVDPSKTKVFAFNTTSNYADCVIKNNIIYQPDGKISNTSNLPNGIDFDGNAWSVTSATVPAALRDVKDHYNISLDNPNLDFDEAYNTIDPEDYRPIIQYTGPNIPEITTDFYGDVRVGNWMGALGDSGGAPPDPPPSPPTGKMFTGLVKALMDTTAGDATALDADMASNIAKAMLAFTTPATVANTSVDHARFAIGAASETAQNVQAIRGQDNQATGQNVTIGVTDMVSMVRSASGANPTFEASRKSFITNGVIFNKAAAQTESATAFAALFGGDDVLSQVGTFTVPSAINSTVSVNVPFEYNLLFIWAGSGVFDDSSSTFINQNIGISTGLTKQYVLNSYHVHAANPTDIRTRLQQGYVGYRIDNGQTLRITANDDTGFDAIHESATGARTYGYLALQFNGARTYVGVDTMPATTTTKKHFTGESGSRFRPSIVIGFPTLLTALDTTRTNTEAGGFGAGAWMDTDKRYCLSLSNQDNTTPTQTKSIYDTKAVNLMQHDGTAGIIADVSSMDTDGTTLNYTTVLASERYILYCAVEGLVAPIEVRPKLRKLMQGLGLGMKFGF